MAKEKMELSLQDESGQECVAYPFVESTDVSLSNGMDIETMIAQDVSLPTIVHSETSFKAGVGDSDVSNSIVDSSVASMTIKGQTYQNILPEPSLRNSMVDGKTMQKLNEGYDNVNVVDGIGKNVVLDGQTSVNGITSFTKYSPTTTGNAKTTVVSTSHYIFDFSQNEAQDKGKVLLYMFGGGFKENAQYTVDYWIYENTMTRTDVDKGNVAKINLNSYNTGFVYVTEGEVGHFTKQITTPSVSTQTGSGYIETFTTCIGKLDIAIVIREGHDLEPLEEHFEGMASVKAPTVTTVGKNLLNMTNVVNGNNADVLGWRNEFTNNSVKSTRLIEDGGRFACGFKIYVKPSTTYTLSFEYYRNGVSVEETPTYIYHNSGLWGNFLTNANKKTHTFTTKADTKYIVVSANYGSNIPVGDVWETKNIQLEESSTATTYEPHKSNSLSTKNVLANTTLGQGCINPDGSLGAIVAGDEKYAVYTEIIKVNPNSTYLIKTSDENITYDRIAYYDSNKTFIKRSDSFYTSKLTELNIPSNTHYIRIAFHKGAGIAITPSQLGNVVCQEIVKLRSLPNGVYDTLNLVTGEYVQRIGEIVLDGSETWYSATGSLDGLYERYAINLPIKSTMVLCNKIKGEEWKWWEINGSEPPREAIFGHTGLGNLNLVVKKENVEKFGSLEAYLQQNPITVQYELATPTIKTVDLSSFGNWEKVVLDGSEGWQCDANNETGVQVYIPRHQGQKFFNSLKSQDGGGLLHDLKNTKYFKVFSIGNNYGMTVVIDKTNFPINIGTNITLGEVRELWKQWLSQNPITVWYQTETHQDSTQVKQPIFFKDGHVQLSSGADNSLIPSLSYEVPTSNSYHLDLAKASTQYTMKSSQSTGTFTIDETQYNVTSNGVFTTPSIMTDKLMITSTSISDMMLLEGDMREKDIPYFKGIKSAFEDESKIEVLSTGKNLYPYGDVSFTPTQYNWYDAVGTVKMYGDIRSKSKCRFPLRKGTYYFSHGVSENIEASQLVDDNENILLKTWSGTFTLTEDAFLTLRIKPKQATYTEPVLLTNILIAEKTVATTHEPYKSNNTKIPLLSPLRSLPNGVCDEIILDRENNKAQIIQRVGSIVLDGSDSEEWHFAESNRPDTNTHYVVCANSKVFGERLGKFYSDVSHGVKAFFQDKFAEQAITVWKENGMEMFALHLQDPTHFRVLQVKILKNRLHSTTIEAFREWLSLNPITVQYELAEPVVTEVDLSGFPYIYKDGHIFLDTDIVPISEITYSINQQQQIEASNEDLMRHEKKITNLHKLIGTYVNVEYESTLLALNLELK